VAVPSQLFKEKHVVANDYNSVPEDARGRGGQEISKCFTGGRLSNVLG